MDRLKQMLGQCTVSPPMKLCFFGYLTSMSPHRIRIVRSQYLNRTQLAQEALLGLNARKTHL
jgi:hypothetical protein